MLNKNSKTQLWGLVRQENWPQNGYDRKKAQKFSAHASHEILINPNQATTPGTCRDVDLSGQVKLVTPQSLNSFYGFERGRTQKPFAMNRAPDRHNEMVFQQPEIFTSPTATESTEDGTENSIGDVNMSPKVEVKNEEVKEESNGYFQRLGQFLRDINGAVVQPYDGLSESPAVASRSSSLSFHDAESGENYQAPVIHTTMPMVEVATSANTWGSVAQNPVVVAVPGLAPEHHSAALNARLSNLMPTRPKRNVPTPVYTKLYPELGPASASSSSSGGSEYLPTNYKDARGNAIYRTRMYTMEKEFKQTFGEPPKIYKKSLEESPLGPPPKLGRALLRPIKRDGKSPTGVSKKVAGVKRRHPIHASARGNKIPADEENKPTREKVYKGGKRVSATNNNRDKLLYKK